MSLYSIHIWILAGLILCKILYIVHTMVMMCALHCHVCQIEFPYAIHSPLVLQSFYSYNDPGTLEEAAWYRCSIYSWEFRSLLLVDQLLGSVLFTITIYYKKNLWWVLRNALIYVYKDKNLGNNLLCLFNRIIGLGSLLRSMTQPVTGILPS